MEKTTTTPIVERRVTTSAAVLNFDQGDDVEFVCTVWRWEVANQATEQAVSDRVHKMLLPYNDPTSPVSAYAKMKSHLIDTIRKAKLQYKDLDTTKFGLKSKEGDYDITGNGAFANAVKVFLACAENGGDLKVYVTMNSARQFNKAAKDAKTKAEREGKLYNEQALLLKHQKAQAGETVDENSPEFKREVMSKVSGMIATGGDKVPPADEDTTKDEWYFKGLEIADALRDYYKISKNKAQAEQMFEAAVKRIQVASQAFLALKAEQAMSTLQVTAN